MANTIYNLDKTWLPNWYWLSPPLPSDEIMCSFLAIPSPNPTTTTTTTTTTTDLSQFGTIKSETSERLEIRLTAEELENIHELKQAWVSKYADEGMICFLRLCTFKKDLSRKLVFQRGYKIPEIRQADTTANPTLPAAASSNTPPLLPSKSPSPEKGQGRKNTGKMSEKKVGKQIENHTKGHARGWD